MPLMSESVANALLDYMFSGSLATEWEVVQFYSDPALEDDPLDVEIPESVRAVLVPADFEAASGFSISTTDLVQTPDVLAAFSDPVAFYGLLGDDDAWYWTAPLSEPVEVTEAGPGPEFSVTVFIDESIEEPV